MLPKPQKLCILLSVALMAGCASRPKESIDDVMRSYFGHPSSDLVARWGPPQNIMQDRQGGEIWTYYQNRQWSTPGQSYTTSTGNAYTRGTYHGSSVFGGPGYSGNTTAQGQAITTYQPPQTHGYQARRTFFINASNIVYRYAWQGK
jgi:hypothetical protein